MRNIQTLAEWHALRDQNLQGRSIGFVPTMGNLHAGHALLIKQCQADNDITVVSIFINETQFNDRSDYTNYPRTSAADQRLLTEMGVDYCLCPDAQSMYADNYQFRISSHVEDPVAEDLHRPEHFTGVLTVVMKLLLLVRPHRVYFGEKDFQQYQLIDGMVKAFFLPTTVVPVATLREADGLAYSSRNTRLSTQGRKTAGQFAQLFGQAQSGAQLKKQLENAQIDVEYAEVINGRLFVAVNIDGIRLIDNRAIDMTVAQKLTTIRVT